MTILQTNTIYDLRAAGSVPTPILKSFLTHGTLAHL
jgi:hypothetical protein